MMKVTYEGVNYYYEDFTYHSDMFGYKSPIDISMLPQEVIDMFLELHEEGEN